MTLDKRIGVVFFLVLFAIKIASAGLYQEVADMPEKMTDRVSSDLKNVLINFAKPIVDSSKVLIKTNINPDNYKSQWQQVVQLLSLFYVIMFLVIGFKFLMGNSNEANRSEAKEWLRNAFIIIVLVNASIYLYGLILEVGNGAANVFWNPGLDNFFRVENLANLNFAWLGLFSLFAFLAFLSLIIRTAFIIAGTFLFPIGIAMFFTPPLREYGSLTLNVLFVAIFLQAIDAIALSGTAFLQQEFAALTAIQMFGPSLGYLLIFVINSSLLSFATLKAVGASAKGIQVTLTEFAQKLK